MTLEAHLGIERQRPLSEKPREFLNPQDDLKMTWHDSARHFESIPDRFPNHSADINGADDPTRTDDLLITSERFTCSLVRPACREEDDMQ